MICILDDDKSVLRGFQILLMSAGMESNIYCCVQEFLENWKQDKKDILILDIHMPGLNGCDLLQYLLELKLHIPVILITASEDMESRDAAKKYGVLAYLTKPVDGEVILDLLKKETFKLSTHVE